MSLSAPFSLCSWLRLSKSESPAQALDNGDAAVGAGAALQGWLGLHLPTAGVKGEDPVGAFPTIIPPTSDVDLPITHSHATALLGVQIERQSATGSSLGLTLSLAGQARQQNLDPQNVSIQCGC